ncbi:hypothetical protein L2E82_39913 [Cichorium intybus]|uniref:Uncharacterized protein n=1 Tax=Cichorium intybus TaxID=13427 RepID=A0ACB9AKI3_CICIN|nr:hypothetical protein L2E82_39913 [Cichorium intybus]
MVGDRKGIQIDKESGVRSVNTSRKWYMDQPYILASQAKQVFYAPDLKLGNNWYVVQSSTPRALYDVHVQMEEVHQEQEPHLNLTVDLNIDQLSLTRGSVPLDMVDGLTVALHDITQKAYSMVQGKAMQRDYKLSSYSLNSVSAHFLNEKMVGPGKGLLKRSDLQKSSSTSSSHDAMHPKIHKGPTNFRLQDEDEEEHEEDYEEGREGDYEEEEHEVDSVREENIGSTSHGVSVTRKESRALNEAKKRRSNKETLVFEVDECAGRIIGEDSQHFITKGGCVVRDHAKFDGTTWRNQTDLLKYDIITKCMENSTYDPKKARRRRSIDD